MARHLGVIRARHMLQLGGLPFGIIRALSSMYFLILLGWPAFGILLGPMYLEVASVRYAPPFGNMCKWVAHHLGMGIIRALSCMTFLILVGWPASGGLLGHINHLTIPK